MSEACVWMCVRTGVPCTPSAHMYVCSVCAHTGTQERGGEHSKAGRILELYLCRAQGQRASCSVLLGR